MVDVRKLTIYIAIPEGAEVLGRDWMEKFIADQIESATRHAAEQLAKELCG